MKHRKTSIRRHLGAFLIDPWRERAPLSPQLRYGIAMVAVLIAFGLRYALHPILGSEAIYIVFVPAIIVAGLYCGLGPSLLASATSFALAKRFFSSAAAWTPQSFHDVWVGAIYVLAAFVVVWLVNTLRLTALELQREADQRRRAEKEVRTGEQRLQEIADNSPNMFFLKDVEGRYLFTNRKFESLTDLRSNEIIGKTDYEIFSREQADEFRANDLQVMQKGSPIEFEEKSIQEDGLHISIANKFPLRDASGGIFATGGIVTDITERKRAEDEMCKARKGYADLVSSIDGIVWEAIAHPMRFIFVSKKAERLLLYPVERWINEPNFWQDHIHPSDRKWAVDFCIKSLQAQKDHDFEYRMITADGRTVWVRDMVNVVVQPDGEIRLRGVMVEITKQKEMEQALQESEERLRVLADTAVDAIISADEHGDIIQFNRAAEQIFGFSPEEALGQSVTILMPPRFQEKHERNLAIYLRTGKARLIGKTAETVGRRKDASEFPVEFSLSSWKASGKIFFTAIIRDITKRKRAEAALRRSEEQLRMATEGSGADLWTWDIERDLLECPSIHAPFGFDSPIPLDVYMSHVHALDRGRLRAEVESCILQHREFNFEFRVVWPDGKIGWRHSRGTPYYANGKAVRFSGISLDITQRKEAEEALQQSEELLRTTTEGAYVGLWHWNIKSDAVVCNAIGYRQLMLPRGERINLEKFINAIHPDDRTRMSEAIQRCLETHSDINLEHRILQEDGQERWMHCKGHLTSLGKEPSTIGGMSLDITDKKRAEAALEEATHALSSHAEELEQRVAERTAQLQTSLRDMENFCYSIAHDLRAPLRGMRGFAEALEEDYGAQLDATANLYCDRIRDSASRMDQLISDLLAFGRLAHLELPTQMVDLNEEMEKVLARSSEQLEETHAEIQLDRPLPKVCADAPVLDQILENLIVNAMKFVPTERRPHIHIYAEAHNGNVRLWIEDNGIGIAPEHHNRIFGAFERLHTTEAYPGTGIGLAIVQRGVEKMGGHVGVESEPGKGSRFWIELPAQES